MADIRNLGDLIDSTCVECLNEDSSNVVGNLWQPNQTLFLSSADDEQLLIKVGFKTPVKLSQLRLRGVKDGLKEGFSPNKIRLFSNTPSMGFMEAESESPLRDVTLDEKDYNVDDDVAVIPLSFVKFKNITCLIIFVESNFGAETTRIAQLEFYGAPGEKMDMRDWKPVKEAERLAPEDS